MRNLTQTRARAWSPVSLAATLVAVLGIAYVALLAVVMGYAATTIEFSQHVRNDEAAVATLESQYLHDIQTIDSANPNTIGVNDLHPVAQVTGYARPVATIYVPGAPVALR